MKRKFFLFGMICFFVSQGILRLPLLVWLKQQMPIIVFQTNNPIMFAFLVSASAGIFEEVGRFLCFSYLYPKSNQRSSAFYFGLGHGVMEVILIALPSWIYLIAQGLIFSHLFIFGLSIYERVVAVSLHIFLSILVFHGFLNHHRYQYTMLAILLHTMIDFMVVLLQLEIVSVIGIEVMLFGSVALLFVGMKKWNIL